MLDQKTQQSILNALARNHHQLEFDANSKSQIEKNSEYKRTQSDKYKKEQQKTEARKFAQQKIKTLLPNRNEHITTISSVPNDI